MKIKKIITILLSATLLLSATACGSNEELEALRKENEELKANISTPSSTNSSNENYNVTSNDLYMNKPFTISTEYGTYKITLLSVTKKDWRERSPHIKYPALVISYEVENIDFRNDYYAGCRVDSNLFYVYNDKKTLLDTVGVSYDLVSPDTVIPEHKGKFDIAYDLVDETENIEIILHRTDENGKEVILGELTTKVE